MIVEERINNLDLAYTVNRQKVNLFHQQDYIQQCFVMICTRIIYTYPPILVLSFTDSVLVGSSQSAQEVSIIFPGIWK